MTAIKNDMVLQREIRRVAPPAQIRVDKGLTLQVTSPASQSWIYRFQINGTRREMGLGSYPAVTLADARQKADNARKLVQTDRIDPIAKRAAEAAQEATAQARCVTFDDCAKSYIATQRAGWRNAKHAWQWERTLEMFASPVIGKLPVGEITTTHILEVITPIWTTKTETAARVRNRIELVLDAAKAQGLWKGENPARLRGHLDKLLPKRSKVQSVKHHPALPWQEMATFWVALTTLDKSKDCGARALQFTILTACRTSEAIRAEWREIDLEGRTWVIPGERMKAGKPHRVPLSDAAVAVLEVQKGRHAKLVFPGRSNKPISNMAMTMTVRRILLARQKRELKRAADLYQSKQLTAEQYETEKSRLEKPDRLTVHGFRSTFRDWCAEETHYARDVCEMALAHAVESNVESAYRRGDLLEKRRTLMADWARFVTSKPASNVVKLGVGAKRA